MSVVYKAAKAASDKEDGYFSSIIIDQPFVRRYEIGKTTFPPKSYPNAWLFAFDSAEAAMNFIGHFSDKILVCEASETRHIKKIPESYLPFIKAFWSGGVLPDVLEAPLRGTVLCKDIKPIEVYSR